MTFLKVSLGSAPAAIWGLFVHGDKEDAGDALDAESPCQLLLLVGVDFVNVDFAVVFLGKFLHDGGDHLAGTAPVGVEVDYCGLVAFELPFFVFFIIKNLFEECLFG